MEVGVRVGFGDAFGVAVALGIAGLAVAVGFAGLTVAVGFAGLTVAVGFAGLTVAVGRLGFGVLRGPAVAVARGFASVFVRAGLPAAGALSRRAEVAESRA